MPRITPIHWRKLLKVLEIEGAVVVGQTGDHIELKKPGAIRRLVVLKYKNIPTIAKDEILHVRELASFA